jgi:hypothetical protein
VGPTAGLDEVVKRKIHSPSRESNPDHPPRKKKVMDLNVGGRGSGKKVKKQIKIRECCPCHCTVS